MVQVTVCPASTRSIFKIKCYVAHNLWCKTFVDCFIFFQCVNFQNPRTKASYQNAADKLLHLKC